MILSATPKVMLIFDELFLIKLVYVRFTDLFLHSKPCLSNGKIIIKATVFFQESKYLGDWIRIWIQVQMESKDEWDWSWGLGPFSSYWHHLKNKWFFSLIMKNNTPGARVLECLRPLPRFQSFSIRLMLQCFIWWRLLSSVFLVDHI